MEQLIGTHNSATGEKSKNIFFSLLLPFARTQSKTIKEQYESGCRYFDLRIKLTKKSKELVICHGLWQSKVRLVDILNYLNTKTDVYVMITYEGELKNDEEILWFTSYIKDLMKQYKNVKLTTINIKKPYWQCIQSLNDVWAIQGYKNLDGSTWHTYLPIPWLWNKIYTPNHIFNNQFYTFVDFL